VIWGPFLLALALGLLVSAGLYFAYLWPQVEPDEAAVGPSPDDKAAEDKADDKAAAAKPADEAPEPPPSESA
jgi:hypothetical protein